MKIENEREFALIDNLFIDRVWVNMYMMSPPIKSDEWYVLERHIPARKNNLVMFHPLIDEFYENKTESWFEEEKIFSQLLPISGSWQVKKPLTIDRSHADSGKSMYFPSPMKYDFNPENRLGLLFERYSKEKRESEYLSSEGYRLIPLRKEEYTDIETENLSLEHKPFLSQFNIFEDMVKKDVLSFSEIPIEVFHRYGEFPMEELDDMGLEIKNRKTGKEYWKRRSPKK